VDEVTPVACCRLAYFPLGHRPHHLLRRPTPTCPRLAANCSLVIRLPDGNLTGQFVAVQGPAPREIALTGGTGRYRAAGGEGTLVEFGNGRGRMTLQVLSLVARGAGA